MRFSPVPIVFCIIFCMYTQIHLKVLDVLRLFLHHFLYVHTDVKRTDVDIDYCFCITFCMYTQTTTQVYDNNYELFLHHFLYVHTELSSAVRVLFYCFCITFCMYTQTSVRGCRLAATVSASLFVCTHRVYQITH